MMLKWTEAVLVLPVIDEAAVTYRVCGPGASSVGFMVTDQPL